MFIDLKLLILYSKAVLIDSVDFRTCGLERITRVYSSNVTQPS